MLPPPSELLATLRRQFGLDSFRSGQDLAIRRVLQGQHTLLVMPTGAGKSLAYQLPAMHLPGLVLVISPLIALMKDQVDGLLFRDEYRPGPTLTATYINSSLPPAEQNRRLRAMREGQVKLVYVAPERLRSDRFVRVLKDSSVSLLAVDEAHCVSQWGHDFRPDYLHIRSVWQNLGCPPLLATTATATPQVQADILKLLGPTDAGSIVTGFDRPNLFFEVGYAASDKAKLSWLLQLLTKGQDQGLTRRTEGQHCAGTDGSVIIYVATRRSAEEVAEFVIGAVGLSARPYHAGLGPDTRHEIQDAFMSGQLPVVVATNAFGMGIDKANIRSVIHYHMPATLEAYYQEAGRAGRDGLPARCTLLFSPDDRRLQAWFIDSDKPTWVDLNNMHRLLQRRVQDGYVQVDHEEIGESSDLHPVTVRVILSELEMAGALQHLGDQAGFSRFRVLQPAKRSLETRAQLIAARAEHRHQMLGQVIEYAETTECRRRYLLEYFGDHSCAENAVSDGSRAVSRCCDNCSQLVRVEDLPRAESAEEWVPLVILETVHTLPRSLGRVRLAQVLTGSRAQDVKRMGYDQHKFHGKLRHLGRDQVVDVIDALTKSRYLKLGGGDAKWPVLTLTDNGRTALTRRVAIPLPVVVGLISSRQGSRRRQPVRQSSTLDETLSLFRQGLAPSQVADKRDLTVRTVYNHLADLIARGDVGVEEVVKPDAIRRVQDIAASTETDRLSSIKRQLPSGISYGEIRCVLAALGKV